jgi:hypothetical protein|tara:strand:+ start:1724 stop:2596 length:873 start_codon:yes stop_codon:yes gene_type:complete
MRNRAVKYAKLALLFALSCLTFIDCENANLLGQDFRIDSQVYVSGKNLPVSENITLFSSGIIYDFQLSNGAAADADETVIFDTRNKRFTLLNHVKETKLDLTDLQLLSIYEGVRKETKQDHRSKFLTDDPFVEDIDLSVNLVTLSTPQIEYRFSGSQPKNVLILEQYNDFLYHFTMLNVSDPTKVPPFARMEVNRSIKRLGWVPTEIEISVKQNGLFRESYKAKSKHTVRYQLSEKDQEKIESIKKRWAQFKPVSLAEYRGFKKEPRLKLPEIRTASFEEDVPGDQRRKK